MLGACSGAYGALKAALAEPSVAAISLINLPWVESQERAVLVDGLDRLRDRGAEVLLLSEQEAVRDELARYGRLAGSERWPQLTP